MQTIRVREKTDRDGTLLLRLPLGRPEAEYDVVVILQPKDERATPRNMAQSIPSPPSEPWDVINVLREELARSGRVFPDSTPLIREDRER